MLISSTLKFQLITISKLLKTTQIHIKNLKKKITIKVLEFNKYFMLELTGMIFNCHVPTFLSYITKYD